MLNGQSEDKEYFLFLNVQQFSKFPLFKINLFGISILGYTNRT